MIDASSTKTILVTGGCGFIGHQVSTRLCQLGHDVHVIDTLTNYNHYETYQHQKNILIIVFQGQVISSGIMVAM